MKKIPTFLSIAALIIGAIAFYYATIPTELVYVDVNKLFEGYARTKIEKAAFDQKTAGLKSKLDTIISNWQKEVAQYEKQRGSLPKREADLKQQLLASKQQQINNYQNNLEKEVQAENEKVRQTVINDINDYIKDYGKKNHHKMIFGASGTGNIMYAEESTDLTDAVLKGMNEKYAKK
jgi:outer membrane protein